MKGILRISEMWGYVNEFIISTADTKDDFDIKDGKALGLFQICLSEEQILHIRDSTTSKEAWDKLKEVHDSDGPVKLCLL